MARPYKVATTISNMGISSNMPLFIVNDANKLGTDLLGLAATNSTGAAYYIKFYWSGQQNLTYSQLSAVMTNAACTVVPALTVEVPTTGLVWPAMVPPLGNQGQLYFWAVSTAADATNTSLASGGDAITVFID
jgi:hypothetical protein